MFSNGVDPFEMYTELSDGFKVDLSRLNDTAGTIVQLVTTKNAYKNYVISFMLEFADYDSSIKRPFRVPYDSAFYINNPYNNTNPNKKGGNFSCGQINVNLAAPTNFVAIAVPDLSGTLSILFPSNSSGTVLPPTKKTHMEIYVYGTDSIVYKDGALLAYEGITDMELGIERRGAKVSHKHLFNPGYGYFGMPVEGTGFTITECKIRNLTETEWNNTNALNPVTEQVVPAYIHTDGKKYKWTEEAVIRINFIKVGSYYYDAQIQILRQVVYNTQPEMAFTLSQSELVDLTLLAGFLEPELL